MSGDCTQERGAMDMVLLSQPMCLKELSFMMRLFAHPYTWLQRYEGIIEDVEIDIGFTKLWIIIFYQYVIRTLVIKRKHTLS